MAMITAEKLSKLDRACKDASNLTCALTTDRYSLLLKAAFIVQLQVPKSGADLAVIAKNYAAACPKTGSDAKFHKAVAVILLTWADKCLAYDRQILAAEEKEHAAFEAWRVAKTQYEEGLTFQEMYDACTGLNPDAYTGFHCHTKPDWMKSKGMGDDLKKYRD